MQDFNDGAGDTPSCHSAVNQQTCEAKQTGEPVSSNAACSRISTNQHTKPVSDFTHKGNKKKQQMVYHHARHDTELYLYKKKRKMLR